MIIWTSAKSASITPSFDYETPSTVRQLVASGAALPPNASECVLPSEVAQAVPQGMVMQVGYGPEAYFSDVAQGAEVDGSCALQDNRHDDARNGQRHGWRLCDAPQPDQQPQQQPPSKHHRIGLGDVLGSIPH